jgi:hypothetical protein
MTTTATNTPEPAPDTTEVNDQPDAVADQALAPAAGRPADTGLAAPGKGTTIARSFAGLMPQTIGEAFLLSTYLAKSNAIPRSLIGKPESILTIVLAGIEMGLTPIRALQSITNISGTLCMKADLQLALVQRSNTVAFYEESFEVKGKTDTTLARRVGLALKPLALDDDAVALAIEKIQAAAVDLAAGNPYAWAMGIRQGTTQLHVRTFTFADAMKAVIYEASEDGSGPKEKKPLAEKFNYKSFPGDMYPKRARTRLLQVLASDITAGLPAAEAIEGGQIIEAEFVHAAAPSTSAQGDNAQILMIEIQGSHPDLALSIQKAFEELQLAPAKQLQLLTQFKGKPEDLHGWCRDEYAKRRGAPAAPPKGSGTGKKKSDKNKPVKGASHPDGPARAAAPVEQPKPEPPKAETPAEKMKAAVAAVTKKTQGGSF